MNYQETLDWLFGLEARGIKFGLENTAELLRRMGNPQNEFRSVHVGGTNGKGSVSALISSSLREAGYRVGLYTSPHIVDFGERIQVDGKTLTKEDMLRLAEVVRKISTQMADEDPERRMTFFELTTTMAFARFAEMSVDWAVIEVGMGGRLDATNVINPECVVITRVGREHTEFLGGTIDEIAYEKAGILKPGVVSITGAAKGEGLEVIQSRADDLKSPLRVLGRDLRHRVLSTSLDGTTMEVEGGPTLFSHLPGRFQGDNMALAYMALREIESSHLTEEVISKGMEQAVWPGRLETIHTDPRIILDATHTAEGARAVASEIEEMVEGDIILVLGVLNDKDLDGMARAFGSVSTSAIATSPSSKRSFPASRVEETLRAHCPDVVRVDDVGEAIQHAIDHADRDDTILITGSLYTIGEARRWWDSRKGR